jgi:hypothetical protein
MQSVWGKSEGRVGRLALNLHVLNALASGQSPSAIVGAETMARAIALTDYYAMQVKAMYTEFSDSDALAPHLAKVIELSLKRLTSKNEGWLKASDVYLSITKSKRPDGGTVREWFTELVTLGKGEVKGSGRLLQFRAFNPKLDKLDTLLDKSSNAESTVYQCSQEFLDKLDKLDDFGKKPNKTILDTGYYSPSNPENLVIKAPAPENGQGEKISLLEESSNLSKSSQNVELARDTELDTPSNFASNLDNSGAIAPTPTETPPTDEVEQWLAEENILNIAHDLEICDSKEVLGELRKLYPKEALIEAAKLLSDAKRSVIKTWVAELNGDNTPQDSIAPTPSPETSLTAIAPAPSPFEKLPELYGWDELHSDCPYPNPKSNSINTSQQRALKIREAVRAAGTKQDLSALRRDNGGDFSVDELLWVLALAQKLFPG